MRTLLAWPCFTFSFQMFDYGELTFVMATIAAAIIIIFILLMKWNGANHVEQRYPPSLPVLPLLVALFRGGISVLPDYLLKSSEVYGAVLSYKVRGRLIVILNSKEALMESFLKQSDTFAEKFEFWTEKNIVNHNLRGIIFAPYNEGYKRYHKVCLSILKEFGFGVNRVSETRILHEVEAMNEEIMKNNGRPFDPKYMTTLSTSNVVLSILFGRRFMTSEKNQRELIHNSDEYTNNIDIALSLAPLLRFVPHFRRKIDALTRGNENISRAIEEGIQCSKTDETEFSFVRRFLELEGPQYDHQDLLYILRDLCLASTGTLSTTLQWALVELANHPEVQTRFQREIDDVVVPGNRFPSLEDKPHLPYTEAVILEVMRRRTIAPILPPRAVNRDTQVFGYFIPKGSLVIANIYSVHMNPKVWKEPENFNPERFLDNDGNVTGADKLILFGLGKRSCLGEILARQEVFLFLTSLVQRFDIRPPEDQDSIRSKAIMGTTVRPSDFKVRLIPRKKFQLRN